MKIDKEREKDRKIFWITSLGMVPFESFTNYCPLKSRKVGNR